MSDKNQTNTSQVDEEHDGVTFEVVEPSEGGGVRRRGIYLLPNLFTTAALFAGFYAIIASMQGKFELASIAILVAGVLDGLDGRVARMTNTQSEFGAQYDSLSDLVAFGVAPSLVVFSWSLDSLGKFGWAASFVYVACAALRLARFNVQSDDEDKRFFTGLPSPSAAGAVIAIVWAGADHGVSGPDVSWLVGLAVAIIGLLMVSNIKYHSFKELQLGRVPFVVMLPVVLVFALIVLNPPLVLLAIAGVYAASGPVLHLLRR